MNELVYFGALGGLLPDILRLVTTLRTGKMPDYLKTPAFWISLPLLAIVGAVAVWLAGATTAKAAVAIGFSAPEVISRIAGQTTQVNRGGAEGKLSLLDWWKF